MSGIWGPERRVLAARANLGASGGRSESRTDGLGNEIKAADHIVQGEREFWRSRVAALEGALELLTGELWASGGRPFRDDV